ncbi:MAG: N-acetylmuramic acid 6-phosphate etherase [Granulosicoccaceae bacterium]
MQTEHINPQHSELDLQSDDAILTLLLNSQQQAVDAVRAVQGVVGNAVAAAALRLSSDQQGRLILVGAGASGRIAVQDGAELWPTYGWPAARLLLQIAGGDGALLHSVEGVEDDPHDAQQQVSQFNVKQYDVVLGLAASGRSPWTCAWLEEAREQGALTIGFSNNADTPLLAAAEHPILLDSGAEVLAGSTRMASGTAQKIVLNLFSTLLMIRLNRTHGNLMVDMAATNIKLEGRRIKMMQAILPALTEADARKALDAAGGWVKLAVLIANGLSSGDAEQLLVTHSGSLRLSLQAIT